MLKKILSRRDFLKTVFMVAGGLVLSRLGWFFKLGHRRTPEVSLKEARYYRAGRHLAG